jgi:hypothetical protein
MNVRFASVGQGSFATKGVGRADAFEWRLKIWGDISLRMGKTYSSSSSECSSSWGKKQIDLNLVEILEVRGTQRDRARPSTCLAICKLCLCGGTLREWRLMSKQRLMGEALILTVLLTPHTSSARQTTTDQSNWAPSLPGLWHWTMIIKHETQWWSHKSPAQNN